jgi:LysR family nitrogen assimilation transcriptional regulator
VKGSARVVGYSAVGNVPASLTRSRPDMNLRQLQYFLQIAELRSFTRASQVLHIAQPALSRQIRGLEDEIGAPLFNRTTHGITLTEQGRALVDRGSALLQQFSRLRDDVANPGVPQGDLSVGLPPALREMLARPLLSAYCRKYPSVSLHVHEGISIDLTSLVQRNRLDCAVIVDLGDLLGSAKVPLVRERLFLVGPRKEKLSVRKPVPLNLAAGKPLILTNRLNNFRLAIEEAMAKQGLPPNVVCDSNSTNMIVDLVTDGLGFSILPSSAIDAALRARKLAAAPIDDLFINWAVVYPLHADVTAAGSAFTRLLYELAKKKIESGAWPGAETVG